MIENIKKVKEFHDVTGMATLESPGFLDNKRVDLRISLLKEEIKELENAAYTGDLKEVLDALVDIQYLLHGAVLDFGMQSIYEKACDEVHKSNMSKFCKDTASARESVNRYLDKNVEAYYKKIGDRHIIFRSIDDKILKGMHFYEPRLKRMIDLKLKKAENEK